MIFNKYIKSIFLFFFLFKKINWIKFLKLYSNNADNIIYLSFLAGRFSNEIFIWDLANINNVIESDLKFKVSIKLDHFKNKKIWWSPSARLVPKTIKNYALHLFNFAERIESKGNKLFPSSYETSLYENKSHMHKLFDDFGIKTPKTTILNSVEELDNNNLKYPILLKGEYSSGSKDIYKFSNAYDLKDFLHNSNYLNKFNKIIIQELLNIRRDLRVTLVGEEIVLFYWRINNDSNWKPTASSFGGSIFFNDFPKKWEKYIVDNFNKLNIKMGAFDVAWDNDNLSNEPYFLEVSPRFSPNPPLFSDNNTNYGKWKKKLIGKKIYYKEQVNLIFSISKKYFKIAS